MKQKIFSLSSRAKSIWYAWAGLKAMLAAEHNMYIHLVLTITTIISAIVFHVWWHWCTRRLKASATPCRKIGTSGCRSKVFQNLISRIGVQAIKCNYKMKRKCVFVHWLLVVIVGNAFVISWVLYKGMHERFSNTVPEKIPAIELTGLLIVDSLLP